MQVAVLVQPADVAGEQPAVLAEALARRFRALPVALHHLRALHYHLAYLANGQLLAAVHAHDLLERIGDGRAAGLQLYALQGVDVGGGACLGEPVALRHHAAVGGFHPLSHLQGQRRRPGVDQLQGGDVEGGEVGHVGHSEQRRRHQKEVGDAALAHQVQHLLQIEPHHDDAGGAQGEARVHKHRHPVDVKKGQHGQADSVRR